MVEPIVVSFSEVDTIRQCLLKHEIAYKERWQAPTTGPALSRGIAWHQIMETHYRVLKQMQDEMKAGVPPISDKAMAARIWEAVHPHLYSQLSGTQSEEQEILEWMYRGHIEHWGLDPGWDILAIEHAPVMSLPDRAGRRSRFQIKMKIDLVVRERSTGNVYVVDHKSGKDLPKDKELDLDDQFGLYTWGLRQLGHPVFGAIHSAARTHRNKDQSRYPQPLDERFRRTRLVRTEIELETIARECYAAVRNAYSFEIGQAPRSPDPDRCRWRCDFSEACLLGRKGADHRAILADTGFVRNQERH